ncbi:MAG: sugar phosphate isomerase/epimerase family protein [Candidatus Hydrogenedentota bacterium]
MPKPIHDFSRLCVHTITTQSLSLSEAIDAYSAAGISGITVWRPVLEALGVEESARRLNDSGLDVVSLCRGGFFPAMNVSGRTKTIDDNRKAIEEAAAIGAPFVVLVCGAESGLALAESRKQILDGIAAVIPDAEAAGVKLAIEPLHPMYADTRSAVNTMAQANDMVEMLDSPTVGIALDVYHTWWDPDLKSEIARAGDSILAFHVNDWRTPTRDLLNDRALMGQGCINVPEIRGWVEAAGFDGYIEVEIFSDEHWAIEQVEYLERIKEAYRNHV